MKPYGLTQTSYIFNKHTRQFVRKWSFIVRRYKTEEGIKDALRAHRKLKSHITVYYGEEKANSLTIFRFKQHENR